MEVKLKYNLAYWMSKRERRISWIASKCDSSHLTIKKYMELTELDEQKAKKPFIFYVAHLLGVEAVDIDPKWEEDESAIY